MARPKTTRLPTHVRICNGSYQFKTKAFARVEDGEAAMYAKLATLMGAPAAADVARTSLGMPVAAAIEQYKLEGLNGELAPTVRKEALRYLDVMAKEFADYTIEDVRASHVTKSIHRLYGDHSQPGNVIAKKSAARLYLSRASEFFSWCVLTFDTVRFNPCREVKVARAPKTFSMWNDDLFVSCREQLGNPGKPAETTMMQCYHDLSFLLYQRPTEIRLLKRSEIHANHIHVQPTKTCKSSGLAVDIPITPAIRKVLDAAAAIVRSQGIVSPYVLPAKGGVPFKASTIWASYKRADMRMHGGVKLGLNPKMLRPYAATWAELRGASEKELQVGLVHTTSKQTRGYMQGRVTPQSTLVMELPQRAARIA